MHLQEFTIVQLTNGSVLVEAVLAGRVVVIGLDDVICDSVAADPIDGRFIDKLVDNEVSGFVDIFLELGLKPHEYLLCSIKLYMLVVLVMYGGIVSPSRVLVSTV